VTPLTAVSSTVDNNRNTWLRTSRERLLVHVCGLGSSPVGGSLGIGYFPLLASAFLARGRRVSLCRRSCDLAERLVVEDRSPYHYLLAPTREARTGVRSTVSRTASASQNGLTTSLRASLLEGRRSWYRDRLCTARCLAISPLHRRRRR